MPTNDYVFKRIFGYVGNEEITKDLLIAILGKNIKTIVTDNNVILEKNVYDDKFGVLDIKAIIDDDIPCNIEMQVLEDKNIEKRLLYYWSKMYISTIKSGENFDKLKKTISILIADFELKNLNNIINYHTKWEIRECEYCKKILTDILEIHIIELPKIVYEIENKYKSEYNKKLVEWLQFLVNPNNVEENNMKNEKIKEAKKEYDEVIKNERELYIAELREKYVLEMNSKYSDGYIDASQKFAKKLKNKGYDMEEIIELTGLTKTEIESL